MAGEGKHSVAREEKNPPPYDALQRESQFPTADSRCLAHIVVRTLSTLKTTSTVVRNSTNYLL